MTDFEAIERFVEGVVERELPGRNPTIQFSYDFGIAVQLGLRVERGWLRSGFSLKQWNEVDAERMCASACHELQEAIDEQ